MVEAVVIQVCKMIEHVLLHKVVSLGNVQGRTDGFSKLAAMDGGDIPILCSGLLSTETVMGSANTFFFLQECPSFSFPPTQRKSSTSLLDYAAAGGEIEPRLNLQCRGDKERRRQFKTQGILNGRGASSLCDPCAAEFKTLTRQDAAEGDSCTVGLLLEDCFYLPHLHPQYANRTLLIEDLCHLGKGK